jgi:hypothetical protein
MVISSNTLFHFTSSLEMLVNILKNEFSPHLSLEFISEILDSQNKEEDRTIPMVSFCDLPLSQVGEHLSFYGKYGIGMRKEWGIRNKLNPVMYIEPNSNLSNHLNRLITTLIKSEARDIGLIVFDIMSFIKVYRGRMYRNGGYSEERIFYDEKEWRFVPSHLGKIPFNEFLDYFFLIEKDFLDQNKLQLANEKLSSIFKLSFEPNDIKYIIVSKENEILPMVKAITEIKGSKYSYDLLQLLTTRIISADQIKEDF